jgi:nicotinamidase-related amidase
MNRALIVIDVQNEYVTGNLPIVFPDLRTSLANIGAAIDTANQHGIPVVLIQQVAPAGSPIFAVGSHGWSLHETVTSRPHDVVIEKSLPSAFVNTTLGSWLAAKDVATVTVVGYMTQNCDESTARDAAHRGLAVEFLSDATGTLPLANAAGSISAEELHHSVLVTMQSRFAAVATTAAWISAVGAGARLEKPNLFSSAVAGRDTLSPAGDGLTTA